LNLPGSALSGGKSTSRERVKDDFYATPIEATLALLDHETFTGSILEPACGQGHIVKALKMRYPGAMIRSSDLVLRDDVFNLSNTQEYGLFLEADFLGNTFFTGCIDNVITNPPFSLAQSFIEKALDVARMKVAMFCKIQLLEGVARKDMFENTPLKTVYVFSKRVNPLRNGEELDENGKPWASTMCFAWFVWDKEYKHKPVIEWI